MTTLQIDNEQLLSEPTDLSLN